MRDWLPVYVFAAFLAMLRIAGAKGQIFLATAHMFVGGLITLAISAYWIRLPFRAFEIVHGGCWKVVLKHAAFVSIALSTIELVCFILSHI